MHVDGVAREARVVHEERRGLEPGRERAGRRGLVRDGQPQAPFDVRVPRGVHGRAAEAPGGADLGVVEEAVALAQRLLAALPERRARAQELARLAAHRVRWDDSCRCQLLMLEVSSTAWCHRAGVGASSAARHADNCQKCSIKSLLDARRAPGRGHGMAVGRVSVGAFHHIQRFQ